MAMEMHVLFRGPLPSKAALARTIKELGFPLTITSKGSLDQQGGFMPMRLQRKDAGVEFDLFDGRDMVEDRAGLQVDPSLDRVVSFRWGGDQHQMLCAMCTAAALAKLTRGLVFEESDGQTMQPDEAAGHAAEHLRAILKPPTPQRGTSPADLKRYLKSLLQQRADLVLIGRLLVIRPVRHILRGAFFEPSGNNSCFHLSPYCRLLWDIPKFSPPRMHADLWDVWQPHLAPLLMDVLAHDVFSEVGPITTLEQLASVEPTVENLLLAGERTGAEKLLRKLEQDGLTSGAELSRQRSLLERSVDDVCEHYRAKEAAAVTSLRLGGVWQQSSFPAELPKAERDRCAEVAFPPKPWHDTPEWLLGDGPDKPGDIRFAKARLERHDRTILVVPLSRAAAEARHLGKEPYVLAARLTQGWPAVLRDLTGTDRHNPHRTDRDLLASRDLYLQVDGLAHLVRAEFTEDRDCEGSLNLTFCAVHVRSNDECIWSSCYGDRPEVSLSDERGGTVVITDRLATAAEQALLTAPAPPFGDVESLVSRTFAWLQAAGYGALA